MNREPTGLPMNCASGAIDVQPTPYYSVLRFGTVRTGAGPFVYTIAAATELQAFSYGKGELMTNAYTGDTAAPNAKYCDTNIEKPGQTVNGEKVEIVGIGIEVSPISSPELTRELFAKAHLKYNLSSGRDRILGRLAFAPQGGGLVGANAGQLTSGSLDGVKDNVGIISNGLAGADNFYKFPRSIFWNPVSEGTDSNFKAIITVDRAIAITATAVTAGAGIRGFVPPAAGADGTFVELCVRLFARVVGAT